MATHETAIDPRDASALCAAADRLRYGGTGPGRDAHPHAGGGGCADGMHSGDALSRKPRCMSIMISACFGMVLAS